MIVAHKRRLVLIARGDTSVDSPRPDRGEHEVKKQATVTYFVFCGCGLQSTGYGLYGSPFFIPVSGCRAMKQETLACTRPVLHHVDVWWAYTAPRCVQNAFYRAVGKWQSGFVVR